MADTNLLAEENRALRQQLAQTHRSLAEAEARYDAVFNSTLSLTSICTADGIVVDVNRATLQALDLPIEAFVGRYLWESPWLAKNPVEAAKIEQALKSHRGRWVEYESAALSRKGDWRVFRFTLRPYRSYVRNEARFLVLEVQDLTGPHGPSEARPAWARAPAE